MSVACVGLDASSTSLQLGFPTSHVCCEQVNQNLARSCQIQVEISEKNVDCKNEMELLSFQNTHCGRLAQGPRNTAHVVPLVFHGSRDCREASAAENGTLRRPAMKTLEPSHLQALGTFGHLQNSSVHIAEYVETRLRNLFSTLLSGGNEICQSCDLAITKV